MPQKCNSFKKGSESKEVKCTARRLPFIPGHSNLQPGGCLKWIIAWHPYAIDPKIGYSKETPTLVEFRLEKSARGTLLLLTESGFTKIPGDRRLEAFRMNDSGWTEQMKNMESYVAKGS